jgi:DNA-binding transcriptional LysR family regulator
MVAGLCAETLDIAVLVRPTRRMLRGLRFEELARDAICVAVAPKHPFARHRSVTVHQIAPEPLIVFSREDYPDYHEMLDNVFAGTKFKLRIAEEHDSGTSLIAAIEAGAGVAVCAESLTCTAGLRLKVIPIKPAPAPLIIGAAWRASGLSPAAEIFLRCAKEVAPAGRSLIERR